jgi:hypothetical protein
VTNHQKPAEFSSSNSSLYPQCCWPISQFGRLIPTFSSLHSLHHGTSMAPKLRNFASMARSLWCTCQWWNHESWLSNVIYFYISTYIWIHSAYYSMIYTYLYIYVHVVTVIYLSMVIVYIYIYISLVFLHISDRRAENWAYIYTTYTATFRHVL